MRLEDLKNKQVAVLGFGQEGKAVAKYLKKHGVPFTVFDRRGWDELIETERLELNNLNLPFILGEGYLQELKGFSVIFRSPGIPVLTKEIQLLIQKGVYVTSQTKWFFENCPSEIIGVTGTKGKGTTSTLIQKILEKEDNLQGKIHLTGNIGDLPALDLLDSLKAEDKVVFELSSFQLEDLHKSPHVAVVLMITSEHLDYHQEQMNYLLAKEAVVKFQKIEDLAIVNADYENSKKFAEHTPAKKMWFSRKIAVTYGAYVEEDQIKYKDELGSVVRICDVAQIKLRGEHNFENICAAVCVAKCYNVHDSSIVDVLENFSGLPHRLELVRETKGIFFYNDSFSTTPETTMAAIKSFKEPLTVIVGGSSKNSSFEDLGKTIAESSNVQTVVLVGEEGERIKQACVGAGAKHNFVDVSESMDQIVSKAVQSTKPGGVVLLSPACASFDMFKDYKDRGEQFRKAVLAL